MEYSFEEMSAMLAGTYRTAIYCRLSKDDAEARGTRVSRRLCCEGGAKGYGERRTRRPAVRQSESRSDLTSINKPDSRLTSDSPVCQFVCL